MRTIHITPCGLGLLSLASGIAALATAAAIRAAVTAYGDGRHTEGVITGLRHATLTRDTPQRR